MALGIGLIGCGQWGLNYLRAFSEVDGCRIVTACDVSPARLREAERRHPGLHTTAELEPVLADSAVDVVVVATQASCHYAVATEALQSGKHCLVEKPMTTDLGQARQLRDLAQSTRRTLMVGHVFLYNAAINHLRQLIATGALGELEYLYFTRTNLGPIRSDVNVVWDLMTHDVSILLYLLNERPLWASGQGASFLTVDCEDIAFATLGFERGVIANIRASWLDPRKVREITVVGTRKMVVFNDLDPSEPIRIFDKAAIREPAYDGFGEFKLVTRSGDVVSPAIPVSEPLKNQCKHLVQALAEGSPVLSNGDDGMRVVEIVAAINRSIRQKGAPETWNQKASRT